MACVEESFISVGGRDSVWSEIFGGSGVKDLLASSPRNRNEIWPGSGSRRLAEGPRAGISHRDQLGRGYIGCLGGEEPSCRAHPAPSANESVNVATFRRPRRMRGSLSNALSHQSGGERRAGSPRSSPRDDSENGSAGASTALSHTWTAAGMAQEQSDIFGVPRRLNQVAHAPPAWIEVGKSHEASLLSPRDSAAAPRHLQDHGDPTASRRLRGSSSAATRSLHKMDSAGTLHDAHDFIHRRQPDVSKDEEDIGQQEIFARHEIFPNARRRRCPKVDDRMFRWPGMPTPNEPEETRHKEDPRQEPVGTCARSDPSRATAALIALREAAAAGSSKAPEDDGLVDIFGTPRRQLRAGSLTPPRGRYASPRGQRPEPVTFCWASAPAPEPKPSNENKPWLEPGCRRLIRSGSPMRDQLSPRGSLVGESREEGPTTRERYGRLSETAAGAAQMDVFGSPRRQKQAPRTGSPCAGDRRSGSPPAARTWRWLEVPVEATPAVTGGQRWSPLC